MKLVTPTCYGKSRLGLPFEAGDTFISRSSEVYQPNNIWKIQKEVFNKYHTNTERNVSISIPPSYIYI